MAARVRAAWAQFKARKAEMVVLYGSTFVVLHELLGIASYLITYSLLVSGVIDIERFATWLGFSEEDGARPRSRARPSAVCA